MPEDSQGNNVGCCSWTSTKVCMLLSQSDHLHSRVKICYKSDFKGRDVLGDCLSLLHTVSAQTLLSLISNPTVELSGCVLFSTISVL